MDGKKVGKPIIVNLFAGPSAGKTTAALELTAALKKKGFNVEYVSEFAKELVLEHKAELLKNQEYVTDEQFHRLDRLRNSGVELIVTDSPVLLGKIYGESTISKHYQEKISEYHNSFENFNLYVRRGDTFQQEGRIHNLEQSKEIDAKIIAMLQRENIFYGYFHHNEIDKTVERITKTYNRLNKNNETTEKNEADMKTPENTPVTQSPYERVKQVREEMIKTLLEYIEQNPTDWQSGWNNIAAGAPYNGKTNTAYRGLNALYLTCVGAARGYKDTRWVTFNQAKDLGASVKHGEKSLPVIFYENYDRKTKKAFSSDTVKDMSEEDKSAYIKENVYAVLKYSNVFNAEQCYNFPKRKETAMSNEERVNQNINKIQTIIARSAAPIFYDGGNRAFYSPGEDKIHLPVISAFYTVQDYYATVLHEIAHSTGHPTRLNRNLSSGFGSIEYAKEELRAELSCVFLQMENGIRLDGKHIENHAAYLNSWLKAAKEDSSVFFKAAADAQKIADYVTSNYLNAEDISQSSDVNSKEIPDPMTEYIRSNPENKVDANAEPHYLRRTKYGSPVSGIIETDGGHHIAVIDNTQQQEDSHPAAEGYIVAHDYNPDTGEFLTAAYGFTSHEEARQYLIEEYGVDVGENREEQENIKDWYTSSYPNDEAGLDINSNATFKDLREEVNRSNSISVYEILGEDSVVRERAFKRLAELTGSSYENIYSTFLGETAQHVRTDASEANYEEVMRSDYPKDFADEDQFTAALLDHSEKKNKKTILYTTLKETNEDGKPCFNAYTLEENGDVKYLDGNFSSEIALKATVDQHADLRGCKYKWTKPQKFYAMSERIKAQKSANAEGSVTAAMRDGAEDKKAQQSAKQKREWLNIDLPDDAVVGDYGNNVMVRMPKGEFSYYSFYVPSKFIKEADGKKLLTVSSDYTFRLHNDGKQVELTGKELSDSFKGNYIDKTYVRVAPSRKYAKVLENIEKNVPSELREIPTWCCYRTRWNEDKGKKDKFIISPIDGKWASSTEPKRWVTFDAALKYARENNCEGLSVLLDKNYGITCIDLDKCITDAQTGALKERAAKLVETLNGTYIERSTSGNGLHIFLKDDILKNGQYNMTSVDKDKGDLEVYDDKRIMSVTGDMYSKSNALTRAGSAATVYLRGELGERKSVAGKSSGTQKASSRLSLSDTELIRWIQGSKQGGKFNDLYQGRGVSGNRSDDDAKLAHMLLYFNGGDKEQAFRIMRESASYRPDKPDVYYRSTIDKMDSKIEAYAKRPSLSAGGAAKAKGGNKKNYNQA